MVKKLWRLMGSWWRKEEEEGSEVVVVVVGMEEEMEEKEVVELVVKWRWRRWRRGRPKGEQGAVWLLVRWLPSLLEREGREKG